MLKRNDGRGLFFRRILLPQALHPLLQIVLNNQDLHEALLRV